MVSLGNRIVVLIDMDCFYCQVETRLKPEFAGKPLAVVQYNPWKSGGIIAVNYEARDFGVTRHMRGDEAKEKCPEIILATVPCLRGKADTSRYRSAGREVIDVLKQHCSIIERASVDEAYLDITQIVDDKLSKGLDEYKDIAIQLINTYVVGHSESSVNNEEQRQKGLATWLSEMSEDIEIQRLSIAGMFVEYLRKEIFETTGFRCSAGISFNKILAKLACGLHKPNYQTILPASSVPELYGSLPVKKVKNLGGKLGYIVTDSLKCNVMSDLLPYSLQYLQNRFDEKTGMWLYNIARGVDNEPVTQRLVSKSIGASKQFLGKQAIVDPEVLKHWIGELSAELCERLEQDLEDNERRASHLTVSFQYYENKSTISQSRSCALSSYKVEKIAEQCLNMVVKATHQMPIALLGLSAGKFVKAKGSENFVNFFKTNTTEKPITISNNHKDKVVQDSTKKENNENFECDSIGTKENNIDTKEASITHHTADKVENEKPFISSTSQIKNSRRSSPCSSVKKSLKTDNFKKSFFMNLFKDKQTKNEDFETVIKLDDCGPSDDNCNNESQEATCSNNAEDHIQTETESMLECPQPTSSEQRNSVLENNETSVELQDIFPNLNDIDPNILKSLPSHLQQEANKYLNKSESHDKDAEIIKIKSKENKISKGKATKSKPTDQKLNFQNFFIKINNDSTNNMKKCSQCDQLILVTKMEEHNDYHMAQNLQYEMNRIPNNDETRKRKIILDNPSLQVNKKRLSGEMVNDLQKTKPISSFFQQ